MNLRLRLQIPELYVWRLACFDQYLSVWTEGHRVKPTHVPLQRVLLNSISYVHEADSAILAATGNRPTIGAVSERMNLRSASANSAYLLTGTDIPEFQCLALVIASAG